MNNDLKIIREVVSESRKPKAMRAFNRVVRALPSRVEFAEPQNPDDRFVVLQYNDDKTTVRCSRPLHFDDAEKLMEQNQGRPGYHQKKVKI